jgi:ATP-dependent Clp protease ATP-binding subunit ClpX
MKSTDQITSCSFCGKHKDAVTKLIVGEGVAICNECVELCETLLKDENFAGTVSTPVVLDPEHIKNHLDQYVIGQERAKQVLSVAVVNHTNVSVIQELILKLKSVTFSCLAQPGRVKHCWHVQ